MADRFNNGGFGGFAGFGGDSSGAGLVNRRLFGNQGNRDFWQRPRDVPNRPHSAIPYQPTISGVPSNRPHSAMDYTDPAPPNRPHQAIDDLSGDMPPIGFSGGGTPGTDYRDSIGDGPNIGSRQVTPVATPNRPHVAMDYTDPVTNRPHTAMDYTDPTPNRPHEAMAYNPDNPNSLPNDPGLDTGPDLFSNNRTINPFDEWWRTGEPTTPSVTVNPATSTNSGGGIWEGDRTLSDFGSDVALGPDLNTSLDSLSYGENYPPTPPATDPNLIVGNGDPTGIPVEPPGLNQNPDTEWTRNDNEPRRYLPTPEESNNATDPSTRTANAGGGPNIRDVGNNLSLGAYLNMPLEALRYGTDRYQVPGGSVMAQGAVAGGIWIDPRTGERVNLSNLPVATGGTDVTPPAPGDWRDSAQSSPYPRPGTEESPHDNARSNPNTDWRGNAVSNGPVPGDTTPPPGMEIVGTDRRNGQFVYKDKRTGKIFVNPGTGFVQDPTHGIVNNRQYDRATFGGVTPTVIRDPRGSAIGNLPENSRAANAMLMASQAFGGNPNLVQPDEVSRRQGQRGHLDEFGQYVQDGNIGGTYNPESFRAFVYGSQHRDLASSRMAPRVPAGRSPYPAAAGRGG